MIRAIRAALVVLTFALCGACETERDHPSSAPSHQRSLRVEVFETSSFIDKTVTFDAEPGCYVVVVPKRRDRTSASPLFQIRVDQNGSSASARHRRPGKTFPYPSRFPRDEIRGTSTPEGAPAPLERVFALTSDASAASVRAIRRFGSRHYAFYQDAAETAAFDFRRIALLVEAHYEDSVRLFGPPADRDHNGLIYVLRSPSLWKHAQTTHSYISGCQTEEGPAGLEAADVVYLPESDTDDPSIALDVLHESIHLSEQETLGCVADNGGALFSEGLAEHFAFEYPFAGVRSSPTAIASFSLRRIEVGGEERESWLKEHPVTDAKGLAQVTADVDLFPGVWGAIFVRWLEAWEPDGFDRRLELALGSPDPVSAATGVARELLLGRMFLSMAMKGEDLEEPKAAEWMPSPFLPVELGPAPRTDERRAGSAATYHFTASETSSISIYVDSPEGASVLVGHVH